MQSVRRHTSKINGVGNVKVLITYSQTSQTVPLYNEESSQKDTQEQDKTGGTRKLVETDVKEKLYIKKLMEAKHL